MRYPSDKSAMNPTEPNTDTSNTTPRTGQDLYDRAKRIIPGGTQLLSKRPEMFLPGQWPTYYKRASGCRVWDLDDRPYIDMSLNGIGACLLGFADPVVNDAVHRCVNQGSMCTLNPPVEVELAELLIELHPWAGGVRYARTGGEGLAAAVRITRAATGREKVAFCGYHGWHDWYLAANLSDDDRLDGHLMPGLSPHGVPQSLRGSAIPFRYGNIDEFRSITQKHGHELAAIVMEPLRYTEPEPGYLEQVEAEARRCGAVLVFDEVTSGWRYNLGGVHLQLGVEPDIAVFAKSMSNGYPMAAVIGRERVMQAAQDSFISSTYWTEAIGPSAALATIQQMQAIHLSKHLHEVGSLVQQGWRELIERHGIPAKVIGRPALTSLKFNLGNAKQEKALSTLLTQEMLKRGYLANNSYYATAAHRADGIKDYLVALDEVFAILAESVKQNNIGSYLNGPVAHDGFYRLT